MGALVTAHVDVADCIAWAEAYDGPPFHALLCDPPYHLIQSTRNGSARSNAGVGPYGRHTVSTASRGFMGQDWDGGDITYRPDTWRTLARVLHPGAFGMAFASSRGWHRLACAIEDAGLTIHPSIFGWTYGNGFPKATRVQDAPDFAGHRYGLQALKPALEPIIVFQKPYAGRPVDSITATGAGALWIDGGRVPTGGGEPRDYQAEPASGTTGSGNRPSGFAMSGPRSDGWQTAGRWPANLILSHTPDCVRVGERRVRGATAVRHVSGGTTFGGDSPKPAIADATYADADDAQTVAAYECAPSCPVAALGAQSGERGDWMRAGAQSGARRPDSYCGGYKPTPFAAHGDIGTAARFFHNPDWSLDIAERLAAAEPVRYVAKASRRERSCGLPDGERSNHPTVKPLALAQHLATLLLPPDACAPRRLFVPFAGSGSEAIGAMLAGWDEVVGVELSDEYAEIARARLAWWAANRPAATQAALPLAVNE